MKRLDCSVVVKVKVKERFKISVNVHLDDISSTAEPSVTKFALVMHHLGQSVLQEDWFAVFK